MLRPAFRQRGAKALQTIKLVEKHWNLLIPYFPIMPTRGYFAVFVGNPALGEQREELVRRLGVPVFAAAYDKKHGHVFHRNLRGPFKRISIFMLWGVELAHQSLIIPHGLS